MKPDEKTCPTCRGNDQDAPCAYPSQTMPGCLRDIRLKNERPDLASMHGIPLTEPCWIEEAGEISPSAIQTLQLSMLQRENNQLKQKLSLAAKAVEALRKLEAVKYLRHSHCASKEGAEALAFARQTLKALRFWL